MGRKIFCISDSIAYHLGGGTLPKGNPRKTFLNFRNNLTMLYKNLPDNELSHVMRVRFFLDWLAAFQMLILGRSWGDFKAVYKARKEFSGWKHDFDSDRQKIQASKKTDNKLAKNTAVVVRSPYAGIVKLFPYKGTDVATIPLYVNALNGVGEKGMRVNQGDSNQGNCLTLGRNSQKQLGFFYYKDNFVQPFHAYLTANTINARMVEFDDVTDLDIAETKEEPTQESVADLYDDLFAYKKSDDGKSCRAVWYYGDEQNVTIPSQVEGIPVTALGKNLFYGNEFPIWSVNVPSSIKTLRVARLEKDNPFYGLNDSTIIYLPYGAGWAECLPFLHRMGEDRAGGRAL